jgi:hypothetical protein
VPNLKKALLQLVRIWQELNQKKSLLYGGPMLVEEAADQQGNMSLDIVRPS